MPLSTPSSPHASRLRAWAGGALLLAAALLQGCGGGGGGSSTPAPPTVKTEIWEGTITPKGGGKFQALAVVLADSDTTGSFRIASIDDNATTPPYMAAGSFTLDKTALTGNGTMTVYAPAGTTFGGSAATQCDFTGTLTNNTLSGTLSSSTFTADFTLEHDTASGVTLAQMAGTLATGFPFLSDGNDATLTMAADGTFTGTSLPKGANKSSGTATPLGTISNGTVQFLAGSNSIARVNFTLLGSAPGSVPSDYSGLAVLVVDQGKQIFGIMADNGTSSLAGAFLKVN
jgi:hypothetical protein